MTPSYRPALPRLLLALLVLAAPGAQADHPAGGAIDLADVAWIHGAEDCEAARAAPDYVEWQRVRFRANTWVLRQNKCENYEGPFLYLFAGTERALLIDSGATEAGGATLLEKVRDVTDLPLLVAHSHGHGDHRQGDAALAAAPDVEVVGIGEEAVRRRCGLDDWPGGSAALDLGGRRIEILPIPGHADDDLAWFDAASGILVTGDTLYPGRLYITDWAQYRASTARLAAWAAERDVEAVLGTHIEMTSTPDVDYPIGTTWQPEEHVLPLTVDDIARLAEAAAAMETPERTHLGDFIIWPRS